MAPINGPLRLEPSNRKHKRVRQVDLFKKAYLDTFPFKDFTRTTATSLSISKELS